MIKRLKWTQVFVWLSALWGAPIGWLMGADLPALQVVRTHTNMIGLVQASSTAEARQYLGITDYGSAQEARAVIATFSGLANVTRSNNVPLVVETRGFYTEGDRGSATYLWRSTAPTGQTNIYTIAAVGGGYWCEEDSLKLHYNVLKAGANGMSLSFNNAPVFQAVFDAAAQQQSGNIYAYFGDEPLIYIPSGVYNLTGPIYYIASNRGYANIVIEGDGSSITWLRHNFSSGALLNLKNVRFYLRKFKIVSPTLPVEYGRDGIYTYDCDYGNVYDMFFENLARAIILQNGAMNWNIFSGLQFTGCLYDFLPINAQGTTVLGAHTSGGKTVWFGTSLGCRWVGSAEGKVGTTFAPATFVIPAGRDSNFDVTYTEANKWVAILGHSTTNRATAVIDGSNVRLTFEEQHPFYANESVTIQAEQTVPQDIQDYLLGTRTLTSASMTNKYALLTPGGTITSSLSGYTFLVIGKTANTVGVYNTRIRSSFAGNVYNPDTIAQYFAAVDRVNDIVLEGEGADSVMTTTNTGNLVINGKAFGRTTMTYPISQSDRNKMLVPENIFPDPTFSSGLGWAKGASYSVSGGTLVATNYFGQSAVLFYCASKPLSKYAQIHYDFQPIRPMSELVGRRIAIAGEIIELNHPIFVPTAFTINTAGTGYTDGLATLEHLGRTIQVNLTTSLGAITGVSWYFGAFATNVVDAPVTVVQGSATGGTVTPTTFDNRSYYNKRYNGRNLGVSVRKAGDDNNQPAISGYISGNLLTLDPITGHYKAFRAVSTLSAPLADISGLRISLSDDTLSPSNATGCEAYVLTRLYVLLDPYYLHNLNDTVYIDRVRQHANPFTTFFSASRLGDSWPGPEEVNFAKIFAGPEGTVTTIRIQRDNGTTATIPGFRGVTTTTPVNPIPGDSFISNGVFYVHDGTIWRPLN